MASSSMRRLPLYIAAIVAGFVTGVGVKEVYTEAGIDGTRGNVFTEALKYGQPSSENLRVFEAYVLSYNTRTRTANWVAEHLSSEKLKLPRLDRTKCEFLEDKRFAPLHRATNMDYRRSGYDRGHLAAAGNHKSTQNAQCETFYLSNIAPQVGPGFNRDYWNKLENSIRDKAMIMKNTYIITGPLYMPTRRTDGKKYVEYEVIGPNDVAVPTHFFKAVVYEPFSGPLVEEYYILPNKAIPDEAALATFRTTPQVIEHAGGIHLFPKLRPRT